MNHLPAPSPKALIAASAGFILSTATASAAFAACVGEASYEVTFLPNWVEGVTNYDVPANAHWSPMVVATHARPGDIFALGALVTASTVVMIVRGHLHWRDRGAD